VISELNDSMLLYYSIYEYS